MGTRRAGPDAGAEAVEEAVTKHRVLELDYIDRTGTATEARLVEPYGLMGGGGRWYLVAWCRLRDGGTVDDRAREYVTFYVQVPDVAAALLRAEGLGAKVIQPATDLPAGPTVGLLADPQGHVVGLVQG